MMASYSPPHSDDGNVPSLYGGYSRQSFSSTGLPTPTTPSIFPYAALPYAMTKEFHHYARSDYPQSPTVAASAHSVICAPQPQISELAAFAASMFCYIWFDSNQTRPSRLQIQPTERFLRFMHDVLTTSEFHFQVSRSPPPVDPFNLGTGSKEREDAQNCGKHHDKSPGRVTKKILVMSRACIHVTKYHAVFFLSPHALLQLKCPILS